AEYHYRAAKKSLARYRLREARAHLACCLKVWPRSGLTHLLAARVDRQLGEFRSAEEHLTVAQRHLNQADDLNLESILLRAQSGQMDTWAKYLRRLVEEDHPATPLILGAMANGYMRAYRLGDAGFLLHLWLEREPDNPRALSSRGGALGGSGGPPEATRGYSQPLGGAPAGDGVRLRLPPLLAETDQPRRAIPHLERLRQSQPDNLYVVRSLAVCKMEL